MRKYTRDSVTEDVGSHGFDWLNPEDDFNSHYVLWLRCRVCGGRIRRQLCNWSSKGLYSCPFCCGRKTLTMDLDSVRRMFSLRRSDSADFELSGVYMVKDRRRLYQFHHKVCGGDFWGSKDFFYGRVGCPVCRRKGFRRSSSNFDLS